MSATPINLNKARKARAKEQARSRAAENVIRHGRSKSERVAAADERARATRVIDAHKRDK